MSQATRTNLATNPNAAATATNYAAVPGTGGTAAVAWNSGAGFQGQAGFARVAWTVATTAVSGGISYTQTGLAANTTYSHQVWVRCSKAQTVTLTAQYRDASHANVNLGTSAGVALVANTWTELKVEGLLSNTGVVEVVLTVAASGGSNWASGDTLDGEGVCIETAPTAGAYFDGSFANTQYQAYAWTGAANASTSTQLTYTPQLTLAVSATSEAPACVFTALDLGTLTQQVTVQRQVGQDVWTVPGWANRNVFGSDSDSDWVTPTNTVVTYNMLVGGAVIATNTVTVPSTLGWVQDPLDPTNAFPVLAGRPVSGQAGAAAEMGSSQTYKAQANLVQVIGDPYPVALSGTRQAATAAPFNMYTGTAADTVAFRALTGPHGAPVLVFRPPPNTMPQLPPLCYLVADVTEQGVDVMTGGALTRWLVTGNLVAAVRQAAVTGKATYADVQALLGSQTYGAVQTKAAATSYLDWLQNPLIFGTL